MTLDQPAGRQPIDHVAIVVPHIDATVAACRELGLLPNPIERFPSEGTAEAYVGLPGAAARLLLMQPTSSEGPYSRALDRRGPGLHHVAIHVASLDAFLAAVSGWLLLPASVRTIAAGRTAWLARPGVGTLLEVHEAADDYTDAPVVSSVEIPVHGDRTLLAVADGLVRSPDDGTWITLADRRYRDTALALGRV